MNIPVEFDDIRPYSLKKCRRHLIGCFLMKVSVK